MGHFIQHSYPFYITSIYLQGENNIIMFQYLLTALIIKSIFNPIQSKASTKQSRFLIHLKLRSWLGHVPSKQNACFLLLAARPAFFWLRYQVLILMSFFFLWTASQTNFKMLRWIKRIGFLTSRPATRLQCNLFLFNCLESAEDLDPPGPNLPRSPSCTSKSCNLYETAT